MVEDGRGEKTEGSCVAALALSRESLLASESTQELSNCTAELCILTLVTVIVLSHFINMDSTDAYVSVCGAQLSGFVLFFSLHK